MNVVFCAEPRYFQHLAAAMASLLRAHPGVPIDIHLLTCRPDAKAEAKLISGISGCPSARLTIRHLSDRVLEGVFVDRHLSRETYMRLLVADALPDTVTRALYLDSDIVVVDDLRPLMSLDLGGKVVGAAPDYPMVPEAVDEKRLTALGMPSGKVYVNAGVLLIDLAAWRREGLTARLMEFVAARGSQLAFHDQDAINVVLQGRIELLDCRWNLQARMYRCGRRACPIEHEATRSARRRPAIVHYTGSEKPWMFRARTACKREYMRALAMTEWRGAQPPLLTPLERAEWRLDRALARAGIDYLQVLWQLGRLPLRFRRLAARMVRGDGSVSDAPAAASGTR